jgi:hypothetical protein
MTEFRLRAAKLPSRILHEVKVGGTGVGVGVLVAADSQSTNKSGYRASLWDP